MYQQAMSLKYKNVWVGVIKADLKGLQSSRTPSTDPVKPDDRKALSSRWVVKYKTVQTGHLVKVKAQLITKGFNQVEEIDFFEPFAPTSSMSTPIRDVDGLRM